MRDSSIPAHEHTGINRDAAKANIVERGKSPEVTEGERRYLTVLFCDLIGSTEIASHLYPEEWREIVREYHRVAAQVSSATADMSPSISATA
ncbi:MAG: hypothetical protein ACREPW_10495 [Candidatus Binataceae bacterium]